MSQFSNITKSSIDIQDNEETSSVIGGYGFEASLAFYQADT
jgi:hypothetical protein